MGLFNLTGININSPGRTGVYDAQARVSGTKNDELYNTNIHRYPLDVGSVDKGHYMVIHINEQEHTRDPGLFAQTGDNPTIIQNRIDLGTPTFQSDVKNTLDTAKSKVNTSGQLAQKAIDVGSKITSTVNEFSGGAVDKVMTGLTGNNGVRTIKRTTETIALYMPDTLNFVHNQHYTQPSMGGSLAAGLAGVGSSIADGLKGSSDSKEQAKKILSNLSPFFAQYATSKLGDFGKIAFASSFGLAQNPMLELLYQSPEFRSFRFDFMFYPRSEIEATEVQSILQKLKYHQAPEIRKEFTSFFLVPPSEFDIKFYYNGVENPNIPAISTCILESIDVDYAPNGFSAYEVPGEFTPKTGKTGMPVAIRLGLNFRETEIMTKDHFIKRGKVNVSMEGQ